MTKQAEIVKEKFSCFHCGDQCVTQINHDEHTFCCVGCKNVYELLSSNNLCSYYNLENAPGIQQRNPVLAS
ncbi:MAG: heavy metal translocating P-type ATPase metal-binding domain-containing protein, partial [Bacteroidia bacterium]